MPSSHTAPRHAPPSLLMVRAWTVNAELHSLFRDRRKNLASIAHSLLTVKREQLFAYLGYADVFSYAWDEHRMGKSKVSELTGVSLASEALPKTREAFDSGTLHWTKAREVVKIATPETEAEWLQEAAAKTAEELRALRKGKPAPRRKVLTLSPEEAAEFDQLVAGLKAELGLVSDGRAVLELMRRGASGQGSEAPAQRLVITQCGTCHEATRESRKGPVPVSEAAVAHALCAGEVHDLREADNEVKRTVPARVRRRVLDRDRRRCQVPKCRAMAALDVHHEDGWEQGHDRTAGGKLWLHTTPSSGRAFQPSASVQAPRRAATPSALNKRGDRMLTLCWSHHRARHQGLLRIEGSAPDFRVVLLDGHVLGQDPAPFSYENGQPAHESSFSCENGKPIHESSFSYENGKPIHESSFSRENADSVTPRDSSKAVCDTAVLGDATLALRSLGFRASEASRHLEVALAVDRAEPWTAGDLVGAALRAS